MKQSLDTNALQLIKNLGLSDKAAKVYLASLELGEATVQQLAATSGLKRTTLYYVLGELEDAGALVETKRNKKSYFLPETPKNLLKRVKEKVWDTESSLETLEEKMHSVFKRPRVYFLYGPSGFKKIWDMIFASPDREFRIITEGSNFLDFVREKYILDYIISTKKKLNIFSRQLIQDSPYARKIVAKDRQENRISKIMSSRHPLPFTEIISKDFVAFISPRHENTLFVVENDHFAQTRRSLFEITWESIK
jgi:sugar-specific transcriptional regulator TrmB